MGYLRGSDRDISYLKETVAGEVEDATYALGVITVPTTEAFQLMRTTGDSFNLTRDTFESGELRSDRGVVDLKSGNKQSSGSVDFELSYANFDAMIEAVLETADTFAAVGSVITNGKLMIPYSFEKGFVAGAHYQIYTGMYANTLSLNLAANSQVTGSIEFIGMNQEVRGSSASSVAKTEPTPGGLFDSYTGEIKEGGVTIGDITSLTLSVSNNLSPTFVLMNDSVKEVIDGRCMVEGTVSAYFANADLYNKFVTDVDSSIQFTLKDSAEPTHGYTFTLSKIKYTGADMPVSDEGPVTISMPFKALQDGTNGTIKIAKLPAVT